MVTANGTTVCFAYDGDGHRISKTTAAGTTIFIYDSQGNLAATQGPAVAGVLPGTLYRTQDHLGSTRLTTDGSGNTIGCHDYLPSTTKISTC